MRRAYHTPKKRLRSGVAIIKRDNYGKPKDWFAITRLVHKRDCYRCRKCGAPESPLVEGVYHETDHIVKLERGGTTTINNLQTICKDCHSKKHPHLRGR